MADKKEAVDDFKAEFLHVMNRSRRLRKYLRDVDSQAINKMISRIEEIQLEHEIEEEEFKKAELEKQQKVEEVKRLMREAGIDTSDLKDVSTKSSTASPKYLHIDSEGNYHRWSGRGKVPKYFRALIESGVDIDRECLAKNIEK